MNLQTLNEAPHQWETPEFRRWFGHSIVRDRSGNPLRVYHGTIVWEKEGRGIGNFDEFDPQAPRKNLHGRGFLMDQVGSWFSEDSGPDGAAMYAGTGYELAGAIYPCYLKISNPWRPRSWKHFIDHGRVLAGLKPGRRRGEVWGEFDPVHLRRWLVDNGYDGIMFGPEVVVDSKVPSRIWVALFPEQIKSASGNRGSFNPQSANITEDVKEQLVALKQLGDYSRIPNEDWLRRKQTYATDDAAIAATKGHVHGFTVNTLSGAVTSDVYVILPTKMVAALPGLSLEHEPGPEQRGKGIKADMLRPKMKQGYSGYTRHEAVFVVVNHLGQAWIAEGNNRTALADELGIETIPVNVRYFNGGERAEGPMSPVSLLKANRGVITERRESVPLTRLSGEVVALIDPGPEEFIAFLKNSKCGELRGTLVIDGRQRIPVFWDAFDADHNSMTAALRSQGLPTIKNYPSLEFTLTPGFGSRNVARTGMVPYGPIVYGTRSIKFAETMLATRLSRVPG